MLNVLKKPIAGAPTNPVRSMQRLQFELALDLAGAGDRPLAEVLKQAAETVGADLLFVLPATDGRGETAVVHMEHLAGDSFLQVEPRDTGFAVSDETQMDSILLSFARASVDLLGQLGADAAVRETFAAPDLRPSV